MSRCSIILALLLLTAAPARAAGGFVEGITDLPLMDGLAQPDGSAVIFDKPAGRIVEAEARGPVDGVAVADFYAATLPHLGWRSEGAGSWRREAERLRLAIAPAPAGVVVRFALTPVP